MRTGTRSVRTRVLLLVLVVLALALFAVPARFEGPVLVPISPGHGLSLVDVAALAPLLGAVGVVAATLVGNRNRLGHAVRGRPGAATAVVFTGGAGLGLLLASVFVFFWWWAVGAVLFTGALALAVRAAVGRTGAPTEPRDTCRDPTSTPYDGDDGLRGGRSSRRFDVEDRRPSSHGR